ncbi:MAG: hypothetical protein WCC12_09515 [Anaerolineales bacterium]
MQDQYTQLQFIAANYSKLQGLRQVPVGLLVAAVSIWALDHQGDLGLPIVLTLAAALLYWLIDRYYVNTFGRIRPTAQMRVWEITASVLAGLLALLAFWLDTAQDLPFSGVGLVFAAELFMDFWRATSSVKRRSFNLYPENLVAAGLILLLSLLPLTGLAWWEVLGLPSQLLGMLMIIGILLVVAGIWGHVRVTRALPAGEAKHDANPL